MLYLEIPKLNDEVFKTAVKLKNLPYIKFLLMYNFLISIKDYIFSRAFSIFANKCFK